MATLAIIDTQQLFLSCRREFGVFARLDFLKLKKLINDLIPGGLAQGDRIVAHVLLSPGHDTGKFVEFLKRHGIAVIKKKPVENDEGSIESPHWTSGIVFSMSAILHQFDNLIIVSGSGGFISLVELALQQNKRVTVVAFQPTLHNTLKTQASQIVYLDETFLFKEKIRV